MATLRYDLAHRPQAGRDWHPRIAPSEATVLEDGQGATVCLSVVVPAKDEADSLPLLVHEIVIALRPMFGDGGFEILVVDDGSVDGTRRVLANLAATIVEMRGIVLVAHVGQSAATMAGIRLARGEWIATLDADLQNNPADLVRLWAALSGGYDVALGWRVCRRDSWSKRIVSRWANWVRNAVLGQSILDTGCSVRIFKRSAALRLPTFRGMHRFIGPLLLREGCRVVQVPVGHRARAHGRSHYRIWNRSVRVLVDLLGVAWLMGRSMGYEVVHVVESQESAAASDMLAV